MAVRILMYTAENTWTRYAVRVRACIMDIAIALFIDRRATRCLATPSHKGVALAWLPPRMATNRPQAAGAGCTYRWD